MDDKKLTSMVRLLDDPDEVIYRNVLSGILAYGEDAIPILEQYQHADIETFHRERIEKTIEEIYTRSIRSDLKTWLASKDKDIIYGAWLVNRLQFPKISLQTIDNEISAIANRIRNRLNVYLSGLQQIRIFNDLLYRTEMYRGDVRDISGPHHAFLINVFTDKKGNDISMAVLYAAIAQKLNLPVKFVDFPRNLLLAFVDSRGSTKEYTEKDVVFYINPFNRGAIVTIADINSFLKLHKLKPQQSHYSPCDNRLIIRRLLNRLVESYEKLGNTDKILRIKRLLKILN